MDKEKQIEEMGNDILSLLPDDEHNWRDCMYAAKHMYDAGYRKCPGWISVKDDLPKGKVNCLVHYQHTYCDDDGYWAIGISFYDGHKFSIGLEYKVTHWMPLPEPPKMEVSSK